MVSVTPKNLRLYFPKTTLDMDLFLRKTHLKENSLLSSVTSKLMLPPMLSYIRLAIPRNMTVPPGIFCDCTTHRDRIKWHKFPATDCRTRKKWLDHSGSDASRPADHVSDRDEPSILTDEDIADSLATTLRTAAMSKVSDPEIQDFIAEALNFLNDI